VHDPRTYASSNAEIYSREVLARAIVKDEEGDIQDALNQFLSDQRNDGNLIRVHGIRVQTLCRRQGGDRGRATPHLPHQLVGRPRGTTDGGAPQNGKEGPDHNKTSPRAGLGTGGLRLGRPRTVVLVVSGSHASHKAPGSMRARAGP